ncbi:serine/threonine protein kinase [Oryzobacter terrae]|uniref:serine/threonine protein kinase n=1 Tax=Oryzobacter terrae TaxID=1620385 RepID=UPI003671A98A
MAAPPVPGFELGTLIARGGTSEVWAAVEDSTGRRVAVKVVSAELDALEVAARESALSAAAASAHVVPVEACLPLPDGRAALVMPHLRGGPLDALVRARGHLAPGEVVTVLAPLASALGRLHGLGVVHGDVSPGNVLLELDGRPVLGDLGLGHVVGEVAQPVWGTEGYVAPEVVLGADAGPPADVYALGALGWLCLTGEAPGPPGLRPTLAEVSRAGEGSDALVEVLQAAVSPHLAERPGAHELAWQLFHAARPEPLRLVRGDDETSAVTYRLRAAAGRPPDDDARPSWSRRLASVGASRRGAVRDALQRGVGGRRGPGQHRRPPGRGPGADDGPSRPSRGTWRWSMGRWSTGRWSVGLALAVALVTGALGVGVAAGLAGLPGVGRSEGSAARPSVAPTATVPVDVRLDPTAPLERPAELVSALAAARAAAWRDATAAHLLGADAPGSAAEARDRTEVTALARSGLRYTGLRYVVREASVLEVGPVRARVRTRIDTGAYEVAGPAGSTPRPARPGEPVVLTLVRTDAGWRISDLGPAP